MVFDSDFVAPPARELDTCNRCGSSFYRLNVRFYDVRDEHICTFCLTSKDLEDCHVS